MRNKLLVYFEFEFRARTPTHEPSGHQEDVIHFTLITLTFIHRWDGDGRRERRGGAQRERKQKGDNRKAILRSATISSITHSIY